MAWQPKGNIKGPKGDAGAQGATGAQGLPGVAGEQWFAGAGVPSSGVGAINDWYLNTTNGDFYEKTSGTSWTLRGNLKGPTGNTGAQGSQGPQGATGSQGPAGATGSQGPQGNTGAQGPKGDTGAQGPAGTPAAPGAAYHIASVANPPASNSTAGDHMGLGTATYGPFRFTPASSGKFLLLIQAGLTNSVASQIISVGMRYGTGTAPANGAAPTGTAGPAIVKAGAGNAAASNDFFCIPWIVGGLAVGTSYWCDLVIAVGAAGQTASMSGAYFDALEFP